LSNLLELYFWISVDCGGKRHLIGSTAWRVQPRETSTLRVRSFVFISTVCQKHKTPIRVGAKAKRAKTTLNRALTMSSDSEDTGAMNSDSAASSGNKTVEEMYQKKSQLEHILLRPDTYSKSNSKQFRRAYISP
jgi:hypothetical protein